MKRLVQKLLALAVSLVVALLCAEGLLRLVGYSNPWLYAPDTERSLTHAPGASGLFTAEGRAFVKINSQGLRDREHERAKPAGTFRIALLGDSYAEALQVPVEQTFWSLLERDLAACPALRGRAVEVLNFGCAGYGTAQELLTLRDHALAYAPDLVLLEVTTGNDVTNNHRALEPEKERPFFVYRDGKLVLDDSFKETAHFKSRFGLAYRLFHGAQKYSVLLQLVQAGVNAAKARRYHGAPPTAANAMVEPGLNDQIYVEPRDADWREAWRVTEGILAETNRTARAAGARFLVATLSNGIQVHPDPEVRARFQQRLGVADLFHPERRIEAAGRRDGYPVLALAPDLQREAERRKVFLHGFPGLPPGVGHWNADGHLAAAHRMTAWVCARLGEKAP